MLELKKKVVPGFDAENYQLSIKTGPSSIGAFCRERPGFEGLNPSKLQLSEFFSGRSSYDCQNATLNGIFIIIVRTFLYTSIRSSSVFPAIKLVFETLANPHN